MNLDQNTRSASKPAKARRWASSFGVVALLLNVIAGPASAGTYDGAMGKTTYVAMTGDVNGDGQNDVLMKAVPKLVMIPIDDDLNIPVPIPVPSPTFALISSSYGVYTLVTNPGADVLGNAAWKAATQQLTYAGAAGAFAASVTITATAGEQASFVVSMAADTGVLQITSTTPPAVDNSSGGTGSPSSATPIAVAITPPYLTNPDAGTLPGELTVGNNGAASYSIPLVVPPGTAGMQPNLSLNYSGQGPNGRLGIGWSIGGMSSIHRCGKTIAQDQTNDRIKFATTDRLCLDGQRLVLVNLPLSDDNYWLKGAEYRTEIDSFSRITAVGEMNQRSFKVESKDGRITTYGNGSAYVKAIIGPMNSGVEAVTPTAKVGAQSWAIDTILDRAGNHITFSYEQDLTTGEHRPMFIRYGASGMPAHAAVQFEHQARDDFWKRYIDETRNDLRTRTYRIKTFVGTDLSDVAAGGTIVRDYTLSYENSPTSGRSQLTAVKACANNPQTALMECLPETNFTWGKPNKAPGFKSLGMWTGAPVLTTHNPAPFEGGEYRDADHADYFAFSDFNGDGRGDTLEKRVASVWMPDLDTWDGMHREWGNPIRAGTLKNQYRYFHNTGAGFANYTYKLSTGEDFVVLDVGDFNGDGALDLFTSTSGGTRICLSPLANKATPGAPGTVITFACGATVGGNWGNRAEKRPYIFDAYGDGRSAVYSNIRDDHTAVFCTLTKCETDPAPPAILGLDARRTAAWQGENPEFQYTNLNQMVDFSGIGKPYDVRWTAATLTEQKTDWDAIPEFPQYEWVNMTPIVTMTSLGAPGTASTRGSMTPYVYPEVPITHKPGYLFDQLPQGGSGSLDLSGSGYNSLAFGFLELGWDQQGRRYNVRSEMTLCQSTGRALDCGVRKKYSGAQYRQVQTVGNFVGDGQAVIMVRPVSTANSFTPTATGAMEMCRVMGEEFIDGTDTDDRNMECTPWTGVVMPHEYDPLKKGRDQVYFMDLLGTGRPQLVYYHRGSFWNGTWTPGAGWEVFEPIDVAATGEALDRIVSVTNGVGATAKVEYVDGLTSGVVSRSGTSALVYPLQASSPAGKIIKSLTVSNGSASDIKKVFSYQDAATDVSGRGTLGFRVVVEKNEQTKLINTSTYAQGWPLTGMLITSKVAAFDDTAGTEAILAETTNRLKTTTIVHVSGASTLFPHVAGSTTTKRDLNGADLGITVVSGKDLDDVQYDQWGNLLNSKTSLRPQSDSVAAFSTSVVNTYWPIDTEHWLVGQVKRAITTSTQRSDGVSIPRTMDFTYESNFSGKPKTAVQEPGNSALEVTKTFGYSAQGLLTSTEAKWINPVGGAIETRTDTVTYDPNGRYPATVTNALGHTETSEHYPATGVRKHLTDRNGLQTDWVADGFGRVSKVTDPVGNEMRTYVKACQGTCTPSASIVRIVDSFHGAERIAAPKLEYVDSANRVLRSQSWATDGRIVVVDSRYDPLGRLEETDHPRFIDASPYRAFRNYYDKLSRVEKVVTNDDSGAEVAVTTVFKGLVIEMTNALNYKRTETRNVAGHLMSVVDAAGKATQFSFDPVGNLTKTIDPNGNVITVAYDELGRKTSLVDPDLGWIQYKVDPVGQVYAQVSPKQRALNEVTTFSYDKLGRMTARNEPDLFSSWVFDTAVKGKGQLAEAFTGTAQAKTYQRLHTYDSLGRPLRTTQVLTDASYTAEQAYDAWGRAITQTYRRGNSAAKVFDTRYDKMGVLNRIERGSLVLWKALEQDAAGRSTKAALGNGLIDTQSFYLHTGRQEGSALSTSAGAMRLTEGYVYDKLGSVTKRTQYWATSGFQENLTYDAPVQKDGFQETFTYDAMNRIETSTVLQQAVQVFTYDAAGNMLSKTGVGTGNYQYPAQGVGAVRPHAVASIPGIGAFQYDSNGNLTNGADRTVSWTSFDMPSRIEKNFVSNTVWANFVYGPEHQRTRQDRSDGSQVIYAGAQEIETKGGQTTVKTYWPAGIGLEIDKPGAGTELNWTHQDRLGSVIGLTDVNGTLREKLAYDAWGKRRSLAGAPINGNPAPDGIDGKVDNRGYTSHEMLDQLDLVHMNGRVYDPLTARFMSADLLLQDPLNGQSYNRYSYVMNNPTNLTDPTGFAAAENCDAGKNCGPENNSPQNKDATKCVPSCTMVDEKGNKVVVTFDPKTGGLTGKLVETALPDNKGTRSAKGPSTNTAGTAATAPAPLTAGQRDYLENSVAGGNVAPRGGYNKTDLSGRGPNWRGSAAVEKVAADLESEGMMILGREVPATTPALTYSRRYDLIALNPLSNNIFGVEVKSTIGDAFKVDPKQVAFDMQTIKNGAITATGLTFNGVMYRGVNFGTKLGVIWNNKKLIDELVANGVPVNFTRTPLPNP